MAEIAFRYQVRNYRQASLGAFIDQANRLTKYIQNDLPASQVSLLDITKSDAGIVISPGPASAVWQRLSAVGAAAGAHTVTGVAVGDIIVAVLHSNDTTHVVTDKTSEYTVTAANTIDNTGGTTSSGSTIVAVLYRPGTAAL